MKIRPYLNVKFVPIFVEKTSHLQKYTFFYMPNNKKYFKIFLQKIQWKTALHSCSPTKFTGCGLFLFWFFWIDILMISVFSQPARVSDVMLGGKEVLDMLTTGTSILSSNVFYISKSWVSRNIYSIWTFLGVHMINSWPSTKSINGTIKDPWQTNTRYDKS